MLGTGVSPEKSQGVNNRGHRSKKLLPGSEEIEYKGAFLHSSFNIKFFADHPIAEGTMLWLEA